MAGFLLSEVRTLSIERVRLFGLKASPYRHLNADVLAASTPDKKGEEVVNQAINITRVIIARRETTIASVYRLIRLI